MARAACFAVGRVHAYGASGGGAVLQTSTHANNKQTVPIRNRWSFEYVITRLGAARGRKYARTGRRFQLEGQAGMGCFRCATG